MATFKDGFGLQETTPTPLGGSKGQAAAPYAVEAIVPAVPAVPMIPAVLVDQTYITANPSTTLVVGDVLTPAVPAVPGVPAFNPTKNGFGLPVSAVIVAPVVDTTPADGYLDFAGGVANPKDGFGLPMTMVPHASSTPQPTATYKGYAPIV